MNSSFPDPSRFDFPEPDYKIEHVTRHSEDGTKSSRWLRVEYDREVFAWLTRIAQREQYALWKQGLPTMDERRLSQAIQEIALKEGRHRMASDYDIGMGNADKRSNISRDNLARAGHAAACWSLEHFTPQEFFDRSSKGGKRSTTKYTVDMLLGRPGTVSDQMKALGCSRRTVKSLRAEARSLGFDPTAAQPGTVSDGDALAELDAIEEDVHRPKVKPSASAAIDREPFYLGDLLDLLDGPDPEPQGDPVARWDALVTPIRPKPLEHWAPTPDDVLALLA